jgi:hypothetical protein
MGFLMVVGLLIGAAWRSSWTILGFGLLVGLIWLDEQRILRRLRKQ